MSKVDEAQATFSKQLAEILFPYKTSQATEDRIRAAADVYGATLALQAHVDACERYEWNDEQTYNVKRGAAPKCGDGWYCDGAREEWKELTQ